MNTDEYITQMILYMIRLVFGHYASFQKKFFLLLIHEYTPPPTSQLTFQLRLFFIERDMAIYLEKALKSVFKSLVACLAFEILKGTKI